MTKINMNVHEYAHHPQPKSDSVLNVSKDNKCKRAGKENTWIASVE